MRLQHLPKQTHNGHPRCLYTYQSTYISQSEPASTKHVLYVQRRIGSTFTKRLTIPRLPVYMVVKLKATTQQRRICFCYPEGAILKPPFLALILAPLRAPSRALAQSP